MFENMKKKICVITGCRSDYGLLWPLLKIIKEEKDFRLQLIATGAHLSSEFGRTYKIIERDGFNINEKVSLDLSDDTNAGIIKSVGLGMPGFSDAFGRLKPDLVLVLGDRFEIFSAAAAAYLYRIPIAHLHGGELTEGSLDDGLRHAITKLSTLHFCSTLEYRNRIIQMGEDPKRVFNVGAIGIDNIRSTKLLDKDSLEKELRFSFGQKTVLVTLYPSTAEADAVGFEFKELLAALDTFEGLRVVFTRPGADIGASVISRLIDEYVSLRPGKAVAFINLGQLKYLSLINYVDAVVGNSSSGIIEVPSLFKPTVNIGNRQKGRLAAKSVINCKPLRGSISEALNRAFSPGFKLVCKNVKNPYGNGRTAEKIHRILKNRLKTQLNTSKVFYNVRIK